jgi:hypothetical protein
MGERMPPGIAAHRGAAVHQGAESNWIQKMQTGEDLPASVLAEIMASAFDERCQEGFHMGPEETVRGAEAVAAEEKDQLPAYARSFRAWAARIVPKMVERESKYPIVINGKDGIERHVRLNGRLDLIADVLKIPGMPGGGENVLQDQKTSTKKKGQNLVDSDDQLTWYGILCMAEGWLPGPIENIDMAMTTITPKGTEEIFTNRKQGNVRALLNRIALVIRGIESGCLPPATRDSWICSARFCGWFGRGCPYVP